MFIGSDEYSKTTSNDSLKAPADFKEIHDISNSVKIISEKFENWLSFNDQSIYLSKNEVKLIVYFLKYLEKDRYMPHYH